MIFIVCVLVYICLCKYIYIHIFKYIHVYLFICVYKYMSRKVCAPTGHIRQASQDPEVTTCQPYCLSAVASKPC